MIRSINPIPKCWTTNTINIQLLLLHSRTLHCVQGWRRSSIILHKSAKEYSTFASSYSKKLIAKPHLICVIADFAV
jgi:hypothetical protein